ncbi:DNA alkylation repair protein [Haloimpatiens lingqiaonensis]|uniref:DNA alkylation repair protein n=1 Tax=Haloimpatiens lingqiaonensis TaxID=1380675 RepID=UPI0010FECCC2|nr:DNA alkylation repair protein [Haloimpatiens lingqiaonensis]
MDVYDLSNTQWNKKSYEEFKEFLYSIRDEEYKKFSERIIPNLGKAIGIRMPELKKISKSLFKNKDIMSFYNFLEEGDTYEEKIIQGILLPNLPYEDTKEIFNNIDLYILRIHNWALCDSFVASLKKVVNKNKESFFIRTKKYIRSTNPWEIRFGLVLLNNYFTDEKHIEDIFLMIKYVDNKEYYVTMGMAWLISTCYFVDNVLTIEFINSDKISKEVRNKSIQKILESKRLSQEEREHIKSIRKNNKNLQI